jgi:hypothetical protein
MPTLVFQMHLDFYFEVQGGGDVGILLCISIKADFVPQKLAKNRGWLINSLKRKWILFFRHLPKAVRTPPKSGCFDSQYCRERKNRKTGKEGDFC